MFTLSSVAIVLNYLKSVLLLLLLLLLLCGSSTSYKFTLPAIQVLVIGAFPAFSKNWLHKNPLPFLFSCSKRAQVLRMQGTRWRTAIPKISMWKGTKSSYVCKSKLQMWYISPRDQIRGVGKWGWGKSMCRWLSLCRVIVSSYHTSRWWLHILLLWRRFV